MVKKFDEYTRSELVHVKQVLLKKTDELVCLSDGRYPKAVQEAIDREVDSNMDIVGKINARLEKLHSSCLFCKQKAEVEVPTITHICGACDDRIFGRGSK
jgi:hypothetical protein